MLFMIHANATAESFEWLGLTRCSGAATAAVVDFLLVAPMSWG